MTDTFEQKKMRELEQAWLRSDFGIEDHKSFLLETIRQARIEGVKEIKDYCKKTLIDLSTLPRPEKDMAEAINGRVIQIIDWINSLNSDTKEKDINI